MSSTLIFGLGCLTIGMLTGYQQYTLMIRKAVELKFEYTVKNQINVVDFEKTGASFDDFNDYGNPNTKSEGQEYVNKEVFDEGWVRQQVFSLAEARKHLFDYFFPKVVVYDRTPLEGEGFDVYWDHLNHIIV